MLGLMKEADELIPVQTDSAVQAATERLSAARQEQDILEAKEHRMIGIITGRVDDYSDDEWRDARHRLAVVKGTLYQWFWPEAEQAREEVRLAEAAHRDAVGPAKDRLTEAATAKIAALTKRIDEGLNPMRQLAVEIEEVRQQMSDGGARPLEHPCTALLPNGMVNFQLRIARAKGWIEARD